MVKINKTIFYDYKTEQVSEHWSSSSHPVCHRGIIVSTDEGEIDIPVSSIREATGIARVSLSILQAIVDFLTPGNTIDKKYPLKGFKK